MSREPLVGRSGPRDEALAQAPLVRHKAGDLPRVRLDGRGWAFLLEDVIAFAEARRVGAAELV